MDRVPPSDDAAATGGPRILGPGDGRTVDFGSFGVRSMIWDEFMIDGEVYEARQRATKHPSGQFRGRT